MRSGLIPKLNHQALSLVNPQGPVIEANGLPLSLRMISGKP